MRSDVNDRCKRIMLTTGSDVNKIENKYDEGNVNVNFKTMLGSDNGHYVTSINWINSRISSIARELVCLVGDGFGISRGKVGFDVSYLSHTIFP